MHKTNAAFLLLLVMLTAAAGQTRHSLPSKELTVADLVNRCSGAVVQIVISDSDGKELALGSGFIVSPDGEIITNYHVIKGAHSAVANLPNGSSFSVKGVLSLDIDKDLALLKVEGKNLPFLGLSPDSGIHVGDHVIAIGSPLGLEGSVSDGIISALRREDTEKKWIQTTAPVSHGSSGGPLLNMSGDVVGVITWGLSGQDGQGLNFAIPSDTVQALTASAGKLTSFDSIKESQEVSARESVRSDSSVDRDKVAALDKDGLKAFEDKQYEGAVHSFKEAIRLNPEDAVAWHGLGNAHKELNQFEESASEFKEAVKCDPTNKDYWFSLGLEYLILKKQQDALSALQEVVGIDPKYAVGWHYLGKAYSDGDQSIRCYKRSIELDPDSPYTWYDLGLALDTKNEEEAIAAFAKAVELKPDFANAWYFLGSSYNTSKRYDGAIAAWKKELELKSTDAVESDARIWDFIAQAYYNLSDFKNAEQADQKALDLALHTSGDKLLVPNICQSLALIYRKMGKHRQADYYNNTFIYMMQHPN